MIDLPRLSPILLAVLIGAPAPTPAAAREITVATWSGVYADAQEAALFKPFTRDTGIGVKIQTYDGDLTSLSGKRGTPPWTVVDVEPAALTTGCAEGRFEKIDAEAILGKASVPDFLPGTLHPCGIGALVWSQAVAYDAAAFEKRPPRTLADFFDLANFPGKRGVHAGAEGTLEIALMADGIPPADVYDVLRRPGGIERALAKLNTVRDALVFWHGGDEPEHLLNDGTVRMTTAYAGRFQRPRQGARRPAALMFTNQLWRATFWAIPAGQNDMADAYRFITFATDAARLADLATRLFYGPARVSGLEAVPENFRADLPTARRHFHDALQVDSGYWAEFGAAAEARYRAWRMAQPAAPGAAVK